MIFYIIEEAVNNARKHACAPVIAVSLKMVETGIGLLEIADNGVGFDVKEMTEAYDKRSNTSLGMVNLRERSELVNGLLQIDSTPGKGTKVQVYIPLTEDAADRLHHPPGQIAYLKKELSQNRNCVHHRFCPMAEAVFFIHIQFRHCFVQFGK